MMWQLVEVFAQRAREYSDEVARLGEHRHPGEAFNDAMAEVKRRGVLCDEARQEIERHVEYIDTERSYRTSTSP